MKTRNTTATASIAPATGTGEDVTEIRVRNARRAERAQKIARLQREVHPMAAAALAQHQKVNGIEDQLAKERGMLMAILKHVEK